MPETIDLTAATTRVRLRAGETARLCLDVVGDSRRDGRRLSVFFIPSRWNRTASRILDTHFRNGSARSDTPRQVGHIGGEIRRRLLDHHGVTHHFNSFRPAFARDLLIARALRIVMGRRSSLREHFSGRPSVEGQLTDKVACFAKREARIYTRTD